MEEFHDEGTLTTSLVSDVGRITEHLGQRNLGFYFGQVIDCVHTVDSAAAAGDIAVKVGVALSTTQLYVQISINGYAHP